MANLQERRDEMRERDEREMREREVKLTLTLPSNVRQGWGKGILIKYKYLNLTEESCCLLTPTCRLLGGFCDKTCLLGCCFHMSGW